MLNQLFLGFIKEEEKKAWHGCKMVYYLAKKDCSLYCPVMSSCSLQKNLKKQKLYRELKRLVSPPNDRRGETK